MRRISKVRNVTSYNSKRSLTRLRCEQVSTLRFPTTWAALSCTASGFSQPSLSSPREFSRLYHLYRLLRLSAWLDGFPSLTTHSLSAAPHPRSYSASSCSRSSTTGMLDSSLLRPASSVASTPSLSLPCSRSMARVSEVSPSSGLSERALDSCPSCSKRHRQT